LAKADSPILVGEFLFSRRADTVLAFPEIGTAEFFLLIFRVGKAVDDP
jgi:hypothetical protein